MHAQLFLIGLNHRSAPLEIRERFALDRTAPSQLRLIQEQGPIQELLLLSTCNRVEILATGEAEDTCLQYLLEAWARQSGRSPEELRPHIYSYTGLEAVRHVFEVAASLDSMVLGEPQILGQLKDAYRLAVESETTGTILNRLMHKAFSVAKRIRTETSISKNAVSISYAAVELAKEIFEDLAEQQVLLIGAGEMAELALEHLVRSGVREIVICNRTFDRARDLAEKFQGRAAAFEDLFQTLPEADIVLSSTGASETVIQARDMRPVIKKRKHKPMFFIDIAVPRDIDPDLNQLDSIYLYDIDDLKGVVEDNLAKRREESKLAQSIIEEAVNGFGTWLSALDLNPAIVDLLDSGQAMARQELNKTLKKIAAPLTPQEQESLQTMVASIAKKLYHPPITYCKTRSRDRQEVQYYASLLREIFGLEHNRD
ncbi:MAG: glutamyl-tRNA reductase [Desulfohalobiaceae bacterium]|nr:glutamyl-tRNA reductase [Desulfohalobiaceae bacterium]